jgi:26S proteasome regulatory subunit N10
MEEQRQRQEDEARRNQGPEVPTATKEPEPIKEVPNEEAMLKRALAMSLEANEESSTSNENTESTSRNVPDFAHMSEEEQIAFAMQMSMQDQRKIIS